MGIPSRNHPMDLSRWINQTFEGWSSPSWRRFNPTSWFSECCWISHLLLSKSGGRFNLGPSVRVSNLVSISNETRILLAANPSWVRINKSVIRFFMNIIMNTLFIKILIYVTQRDSLRFCKILWDSMRFFEILGGSWRFPQAVPLMTPKNPPKESQSIDRHLPPIRWRVW